MRCWFERHILRLRGQFFARASAGLLYRAIGAAIGSALALPRGLHATERTGWGLGLGGPDSMGRYPRDSLNKSSSGSWFC
jgi:hypothetical protein